MVADDVGVVVDRLLGDRQHDELLPVDPVQVIGVLPDSRVGQRPLPVHVL